MPQAAAGGKKPRVNLNDLKKVIDMMRKANLGEVNIEQEGLKISLKKGAEPQVVLAPAAAAPAAAPALAVAPAPAAALAAPAAAVEAPKPEGLAINSPMVGTFYRASSPDAAPYVKEGDQVEIGQTVCLIEAMKLMNEIKSEIRGKVIKVMLENAQPVEFGQPLFIIKND
jgi:acetyl-CoA carboxylase biotin carboxyl carrier protein